MNTQLPPKSHTLVTGGTGKTGSRIVNRLTQMDWPVRIGSRSASIPFDWYNPDTWAPALKDIQAVYICFQPDLAVPGATSIIRAFTQQAAQQGIQHVVLLSGRGEQEAQDCEQIVMQCGINWTIVRASWFSQNFSEGYLLEPIQAGHVALPAGDVGEPFVDTDDIADVAVAALTQPGHYGQLYEVTGPEMYSFAEAIAMIAKATGKSIRYEYMPIADYTAVMEQYEVPADVIALLGYLFTEVLDGRNASVSGDIERVLGRPAKDFATYAKETAAAGIWNAPAEELK
ncbi:NmrA family NAD(P)-binding protein [Chitinophaga sp. GbtcB8]|uniref:NmrA family NAD(P)-binding protein n=1 Tax=Chitinophaga sp. GbtcB8 TaxID=2824753 RepID=UPI001C2F7E2D|nr:NmrA family NAD(P)-binding protein [Chitinophaga sp. GbtcB8]